MIDYSRQFSVMEILETRKNELDKDDSFDSNYLYYGIISDDEIEIECGFNGYEEHMNDLINFIFLDNSILVKHKSVGSNVYCGVVSSTHKTM